MKNIFKISFICLTFLVTTYSCQTDVSLIPDGFRPVTFTTEAQLDAQMASLYSVMATDRTYGQGLWGYLVSATDEGFRSGVTATTTNQPALYNGSSSDAPFSNLWRDLYQGVERANIILYVINQPQMSSEIKRKAYKGEALFLRAYCYYLLVTNFGDVPLKPQISDNMGTDFNLARTPSKDVYNYILNDMMAADSLVRNIADVQTPTIVTKTAVEGMIARVCLSMAGYPVHDTSKYQDALTWAQKVINSGIHTLNTVPVPALDVTKFPGATQTPAYSRVFVNNMQNNINDKNITEDLWEAAFLSKSNTSGIYSATGYPVLQQLGATMGVTCPDASATSVIGYSGGTYKIFPKLYKLYGAGDTRRDWAISPYVYKTSGSAARTYFLTVTLTGGGGSGAAATAITSSTGVITQVNVDASGMGYTSAPTVAITGSAGSGAVVTASISGGGVTSFTVSKGGSGYPTVYDRPVGKWRREFELNLPAVRQQTYTSCNFPILRYADVLLMAAEADLMVNNGAPSATAIEYYNTVRRRAYGATTLTTPTAGADVATFSLQDIKDERSRELCFEGLRRQDLIRWGDYQTAMTNVISDNTLNCPSTYLTAANMSATNFLSNPSRFLLFPIPYTELLYDNALVQNTGW